MKKIILIPAYEPDEKLIMLVKQLQQYPFEIVVVDDGSGTKYQTIFNKIKNDVTVISYPINQGKGYALKQGLQYITQNYQEEEMIVTMDSDGQHTVQDAMRIFEKLLRSPNSLILGKRVRGTNTPLRSKLGNVFSMLFFKASTGAIVYDTQTGLRGFTGKTARQFLGLTGNRYDYEMNMLFYCTQKQIPIEEIEIQTIYFENNKGSHFHTIKDSYLIYKEPIKFMISSVSSFLVDYILYGILYFIFNQVTSANVIARILSATLNFAVNKKIVFKSEKKTWKEAIQYALLAITILAINTIMLNILVNQCHFQAMASKVIVEIILFITNWMIQKNVIFKERRKSQNEI